jgi:16S rRNA (guanine966-N2)-methyltransferase
MIAPWLHTMPSSKSSQRQTRFSGTKKASLKAAKPGAIRIISGKDRGRKLPVLSSEGLRPTTNRVKETLFNWLMQDIVGASVLDMFAGSGSLGFEAHSRAAQQVILVEKDIKAAKQLDINIATLNAQDSVSVLCGDALSAVSTIQTRFNIVFIDPPFFKNLADISIASLIEQDKLTHDALIYVESEASHPAFVHPQISKIKEQSTHQVCYRLYRYSEHEST